MVWLLEEEKWGTVVLMHQPSERAQGKLMSLGQKSDGGTLENGKKKIKLVKSNAEKQQTVEVKKDTKKPGDRAVVRNK